MVAESGESQITREDLSVFTSCVHDARGFFVAIRMKVLAFDEKSMRFMINSQSYGTLAQRGVACEENFDCRR